MMKNLIFSTALLILGFATLYAQTRNEAGRPFIRNYTPKEYGAHAQNQGVVQDDKGVIYFANAAGVLEYDGVSWRLIPSASNSFIRSLAIDQNRRVYVGGQGDFGYLAVDSTGQEYYVSLLDKVPPEDRVFADIYNTFVTDQGVYFHGYSRLFRYTPPSSPGDGEGVMKVWESDLRFLSAFCVRGTLYAHQSGIGLLQIVRDSLQLVPGGERFANERIDALLPYPSGQILIATRRQGMYLYDGASFRRFETEAETYLLRNQLYGGTLLPDGTFAFATVRGGLVIIDQNGRVLQYLDEAAGLLNNFVRAIYADRHGALWLALDSGLSRVEIPSPLSFYDSKSGLDSYVVAILRHRDTLYAATGQGVYYLDSQKRRFRHVSGLVARSWALQSLGKTLLVATSDGLYRIEGDKAYVVKKSVGESFFDYSLQKSRKSPGRVYAGLIDGLATLRSGDAGGTRWINEGRVPGINETIRSILETKDGDVWLGTQAQGVLRLHADDWDDLRNVTVKRFGTEQGLPKGGVSVFSVGDDEIFAMKSGLFRFEQDSGTFVPDSTFMLVGFGGSQEEYTIKENSDGDLLLNFGRETAVAVGQPDGSFIAQKRPFMQISDLPSYFIYPEADGVVWFGSEEAVIRYDPQIKKEYNLDYPALIRRVTAGGDSLIFGGADLYDEEWPDSHILAYADNALRFEFAATSFESESDLQFQTFLEGFDKHWSDWSKETKSNYTNLPPGDYRFRVRARNIYQNESSEAVFGFEILPPWYRTWWAYASYFVFFGLILFAGDRIQRRRLIAKERQRAQLREAELRAESAETLAESERERKKNVELLSEIGKEITASLDMDTIFHKVYEHANELADATIFGVGIYHEDLQQIEYRLAIEKGRRYQPYSRDTRDKNQFPVWCIENLQPVFINDVHNEYSRYIKEYKEIASKLEDGTVSEEPNSLIYLPLVSQERVLGVITIQSFRKHAYTEYHLNIMQTLATYAAIALDNASAYRQLNATLEDLKATQQQLVTQEKLASLGALTAGIAHEIKNPLNFVNNFAELSIELINELRADLETQEQQLAPAEAENIGELLDNLEQNAKKINEHGKRADSIVRSMLQHSRGKAGERQATDINTMLEDDLNLAYHGKRAQDPAFNIKIEKEFDESIGRLNVVPQDISRVFLNIISNGFYEAHRKSLERGDGFSPTLSIRSKKLSDKIEIRIRDNGNGIPENVRDKLFNPFFTTKPTGQGTGLGLSISYDIIVQEHKGEITFDTRPGEFTEFIIRLPIDSSDA